MITSKIKRRIIGKGRGAIFSPSDFLDIGSRASVDQALSRLADQGVIRRLTRGLYDYPKKSLRFGYLSPSADDVAKAVARKDNQVLQPSPAMAANQLGAFDTGAVQTDLHDRWPNTGKNSRSAGDPVP